MFQVVTSVDESPFCEVKERSSLIDSNVSKQPTSPIFRIEEENFHATQDGSTMIKHATWRKQGYLVESNWLVVAGPSPKSNDGLDNSHS